ncbi:DUF3754 domain-containing protein [Lignipirellula cremea]|uniref:DUF3754 domain-containing protein n=1 Tax=Lignipirellula cremea TaxID=2528010 RepID=A0A518DPB8_9BACT|nr:DUF3754 domain-containing protein [Lignipirellula cremea]QDU93653.1 hypothetical protein Pla8534_14340 [Lignipirellula cremea]
METQFIAPIPEHFIPIRQRDLGRMLCAELEGELQGQLAELFQTIEHALAQEHLHVQRELKEAYAPFDPDTDVTFEPDHSAAAKTESARLLLEHLDQVLEQANFVPLTRDAIEESLAATGMQKSNVHVDFSVFDILQVYARGDRRETTTVRRWQTCFREEVVVQSIYARLAVVFRLQPEARLDRHDPASDAIFLKLFQSIPQTDMRMLLPGARYRMTLLDQGKIWLPTLSGAAITGLKIARGAFVIAFVGLSGLLGLAGLVGGVIGYGVRSVFSYHQTKKKYQLTLVQSLLYKTLDTNSGVLHRLLDESVEQECRETMLSYFLLWRSEQPLTEAELDAQAEAYLLEKLGDQIDFEADDALVKLVRLNLVQALPGGRYQAQPLADCRPLANSRGGR